MDFATGQNMNIGKKALRMGFGILGLVVVSMGTLVSGGCSNQKDEQISQLNSEVASLKEEKAQLEQQRAAAEARANEAATKQAAQQPPIDGNDPKWGGPGADRPTKRPGGGGGSDGTVITVAGDVLFAPGQATIKAEAKKELDQVASTLKNKYSGHTIRVEGYTDTDPIKKAKFASNEALSQARAEAVEKYLISKGISSNRISAVGMGSKKAKSTKAASRRVEIVVLGN